MWDGSSKSSPKHYLSANRCLFKSAKSRVIRMIGHADGLFLLFLDNSQNVEMVFEANPAVLMNPTVFF